MFYQLEKEPSTILLAEADQESLNGEQDIEKSI